MLDKYIHANLVYYKHNGDDEPYDEDGYYKVRVSLNIKVMELKMSSKTA